MGINELEKVVRGAAREKDLNTIEEKAMAPEFAEAARTLTQKRGKKKAAAMSLLNPTLGVWW
ncbi:hypothetical protein ACFLW2_01045 [Chloroflexota bacterium]